MARLAQYALGSERIYQVIECPRDMAHLQMREGDAFASIASGLTDATAYIFGGKAHPRPRAIEVTEHTIRADGEDSVTLAVPIGTEVTHEGQASSVEDGEVVFSSSVPGFYVLRITPPWPYQEQDVEITAT